MTELHEQSLADVCRQIKSGALSSQAVTSHTLMRIEQLEPKLHSFAMVLADEALARAAELDEARSQGNTQGTLFGVPIAIKDLLFTKGIATGSGTQVMAGFVPDFTATVVEKLAAEGAVIIGKTQLTEGAFGAHHPEIEAPKNPYDLEAWPGVSSSGSGVAVAAGLTYGALGSDTGGSIRFPSACCGLVGIKPTYGRVSRYGAFPLAESLDHIGPMARNVEDAARILTAISGSDPHDDTSVDLPVPNFAKTRPPAKPVIGIDWRYAEEGVAPEIRAAVKQTASWLADQGAQLKEVEMPTQHRDLVTGWGITTGVECARAHTEYYPAQADRYGPALGGLIELGRNVDHAEYQALELTRAQFRKALDEVMQGLDGLLIPTMAVMPQSAERMEAGYDDSGHAPFINFTAPTDYSGHPTITLPVGIAATGLPTSVQLIGNYFAEDVLVNLGYLVEQQRGPLPVPLVVDS